MRVLIDEQLPRHLAHELTAHEVRTVQQQGWAGLTNGELLRRAAEEGFEVFITADQNLEFQQNLARSGLGVFVLVAPNNALTDGMEIAHGLRCTREQEVLRSRPSCISLDTIFRRRLLPLDSVISPSEVGRLPGEAGTVNGR